MGSATNVAIPSIQTDFHLDAIVLAWIPTSYLLSCAVFLVPFGKLADIHGRRRIFTYGIWVFTISSIMSAASVTQSMLIASRIIQGLGSAMIFVTGLAIVTSVFPPNERGRAIGMTVASVYIGLSVGPALGGLLTHHFTWRSVFIATVPLGFATIYLAMWKLKGEWAEAKGERLDITGSILYGAAIVLIMYGLSALGENLGLATLALGLPLLGAFVWWESRINYPVFNLNLFASNRTFAFSSLAALINYSATFAVTFMLSLYLQFIRGMTPHAAGLILIAQPVMMAFFSPVAGRLSDSIEPRIIASTGMAMTAAGLLVMSLITAETDLWLITCDLLLLGLGFALFSSPNMNAIMGSVEKRYYGTASGTVASMRLLGNMLSMGIATLTISIFIGPVQIKPQHFDSLLRSIKTAFIVFSLLCMAGIMASLARGRLRPESD
ncbi:MAG: MFS transporter [Desulfobacteraceae bacterium]|jgi:EmrB/QacA subfamily drug resistance transporter|nr:MAG: MFS transporter [Desulfobacteraceae bacterium]